MRASHQNSLPRLSPFEKRFLLYARKNTLWQSGDSLLVAVSGGPDSVCLLSLLLKIAPSENLHLGVAHCNYQLRGEDSLKDELFVKKLARENNLPYFGKKFKSSKKTDENSLREKRYQFFNKLLAEKKFNLLVLGHQADDQVETFLLRLFRGAGPEGLRGILPKNQSRIRPLLFAWRKEVLEYLKKNNLPFRKDKTNDAILYQRNKIRLNLLPLLAKEYQPNIKEILVRTAATMSESISSVTTLSFSVLREKDTLIFSATSLLLHSDSNQLFFLREITRDSLGRSLSRAQILEIQKRLSSPATKVSEFHFRGLKLTKKGDTVTLQNTFSH